MSTKVDFGSERVKKHWIKSGLDHRELCTAGLLLEKTLQMYCTMFALVKILFNMFYNNCKYSCYNLLGKFEKSSYKSSLCVPFIFHVWQISSLLSIFLCNKIIVFYKTSDHHALQDKKRKERKKEKNLTPSLIKISEGRVVSCRVVSNILGYQSSWQ